MVRDNVRGLFDRIRRYFGDVEESPIEVVGIQSENGFWICRVCGKNRIQKKYPDLYRHLWHEHHREDEGENTKETNGSTQGSHDDFSVGDYVDDYSLPDSGSSEKAVEIQEPSGGQSHAKMQHLRRYYGIIQERIESNGKFEIQRTTHIGSARGAGILQNFKSAVRRIDDDELSNYNIKNDGNHGRYPIVIRRRN